MTHDTSHTKADVSTFDIAAAASPQLLMRLLGLLAQRDLLPVSVALTRTEDGMRLRIAQEGLNAWQADVIGEKMRAMPEVESVRLDFCGVWPSISLTQDCLKNSYDREGS